ncbi:MAG: hypothetical protein DRJ01_08850 [Bacteroidetes bacterium]|nr:MAG: hypothetical protein DRJ01_08850 [Bacteroidota bacterium]
MRKPNKTILKEYTDFLNKRGKFGIDENYIREFLLPKKKEDKIQYNVLTQGNKEFIKNFISDLEKIFILKFASYTNSVNEVVVARAIVSKEIYNNPAFRIDNVKISLQHIGNYLGGYDHATILHYFKRIKEWKETKDVLYLTMNSEFTNFMRCNFEYLKEKYINNHKK